MKKGGKQNVNITEFTEKDLVFSAEARRRLGGIGRTAYWELMQAGKLRAYRVGRRVVHVRAEFLEDLQAMLKPAYD